MGALSVGYSSGLTGTSLTFDLSLGFVAGVAGAATGGSD